jgi:hypothetical protein
MKKDERKIGLKHCWRGNGWSREEKGHFCGWTRDVQNPSDFKEALQK